MDVWSPKLHLAAWTVMHLLCVFSHEVTVRHSDLKPCKEDNRVCVTDDRDCGPRPPASIQNTLNMSCGYQHTHRSMTCEWSQESNSHTKSHVSLIFSREYRVLSCPAIFAPLSVLSVTARIKNYMTGTEIWSQPQTVSLHQAVKPSQPVLTVLGFTEDSVVVSWRSSGDGGCRLRYRVDSTDTWTQALDFVPAQEDQTLTYTIQDLLMSTIYRAAVACRSKSGIWSDWSSDVSARTLGRVPSRPPEVCYRVEKNDSSGSFLLHLIWKDLHLRDAGSHILGYQVSYEPVKRQPLQDRFIQNVTEVMAVLVVEEGDYSVTVTAFNMAGYGPAAHLRIDTQRQHTPLSVRNLWVSSFFPAVKGVLVQWENPPVSSSVPSVSQLGVQWHSETYPSTSHWNTVDNFTTSTVIQDVDPDESYLISVFPIYNQQCGSPRSLRASLQQGALMEAVQLKVMGVTKTTVTVMWVWQRTSGPMRVNRYEVTLRKDSEKQTLSLWPDQCQHTFLNLTPNTEYTLCLLADDVSRNLILVRTAFDEVPAVAAVTPLLLLAVTVFIISILSRTLYKSYFFPPISSPRGSTTGKWLMDPNHQQKTAGRNILDIKDFQVTDVLGEKSLITVSLTSQPSSEEDLHEDTSLLSISHLIIKLSALELDPEYISDAPVVTQHPLVSLQPYHSDYPVNFHHPNNQEANTALLCHTREAIGHFPQEEEKGGQVDLSEPSHQIHAALKCPFLDLIAKGHSVYHMTCEDDYLVNSFLEKTEV
ncbi:interleukin-6 receptor subunit beta isoform X1 [Epinephelus lanceolatus]